MTKLPNMTIATNPLQYYGSFHDSLRSPIHKWFAYPAGYSHKLVEAKIRENSLNGESLVAIADSDELKVHRNTVGMWKAGTRYPRPDQPVLDALHRLLKRNRIPKMRRYTKGSRINYTERANGQ